MSHTLSDLVPVSFGMEFRSFLQNPDGTYDMIEVFKPKKGGEVIIWMPLGKDADHAIIKYSLTKEQYDQAQQAQARRQ